MKLLIFYRNKYEKKWIGIFKKKKKTSQKLQNIVYALLRT